MKKFVGKNYTKNNSLKILIYLLLFIILFVYLINRYYFKYDAFILIEDNQYLNYFSNIINPYKVLVPKKNNIILPTININKDPLVYIYNTHQEETYNDTTYEVYNIKPKIMMMSYYLQDLLKEYGINSIVESSSVKEVLEENDWPYRNSYKVTRTFLDKVKEEYSSIRLYIDLHRDSSKREKTAFIYNNESYAKILFIVGLENENYKKNLNLTTKLNNMLMAYDKNFSRGIYKKKGEGVNGVYNQDFDENTILVELGGQYNTVIEATNTLKILSKIIFDYLNGN